MPYEEDGETWSNDFDLHEEGMAENKPGHRKFSTYRLPKWAKHPLSHAFNGILVKPEMYYRLAGDGYTNPLNWSVAHVAAKYGDIELLEMCSPEELNSQTADGALPAHFCAIFGTPWALQWLNDQGADVNSPDFDGRTPEDLIFRNKRLDFQESEWLFQASKGELTEKNSVRAQEYFLVKARSKGNDDMIVEKLDKEMKKMRKYMFSAGDYKLPYELPTPEEIAAKPLDLPSSRVKPIEKKKQPLPVALLFPGQGSQYIGMMKEAAMQPVVSEMLEKAKDILGWDPLELALNGPEAKLSETRYCQPLMFLAGLAALELLKESRPEVVDRPQATAGLSLGEYTAIVAAGVLEFEDALQLVKLRGEVMQKATDAVPQAMCSVAGLDRSRVDKLCAQALQTDDSPDAECKVANHLFPSGFTCGGTRKCITELCKLATASKALQARVIKAGGAFHTKLMKPAEDELVGALERMKSKMSPPRCAIYFNATGKKINAGADPSTFVDLMRRQLTSEVCWEPSVKAMIMDGVKDFYEVGPLKQLKAMIKRIDADAFKRTENISV